MLKYNNDKGSQRKYIDTKGFSANLTLVLMKNKVF